MQITILAIRSVKNRVFFKNFPFNFSEDFIKVSLKKSYFTKKNPQKSLTYIFYKGFSCKITYFTITKEKLLIILIAKAFSVNRMVSGYKKKEHLKGNLILSPFFRQLGHEYFVDPSTLFQILEATNTLT